MRLQPIRSNSLDGKVTNLPAYAGLVGVAPAGRATGHEILAGRRRGHPETEARTGFGEGQSRNGDKAR